MLFVHGAVRVPLAGAQVRMRETPPLGAPLVRNVNTRQKPPLMQSLYDYKCLTEAKGGATWLVETGREMPEMVDSCHSIR